MKTPSLWIRAALLVPSLAGAAHAADGPSPTASSHPQPAASGDSAGASKLSPVATSQPPAVVLVPLPSNADSLATPSKPQDPVAAPPPPARPASMAQPPIVPQVSSAPAATSPEGQWVYTQQYGWVWMPYAQEYTYISPEGSPYEYAYYPAVGWSWAYAPWIYGWGPGPYWGAYGRVRFSWYAHPWFGRPGYGGPGYRGGGYGRAYGGGYRGRMSRGGMRSGGHGGHR